MATVNYRIKGMSPEPGIKIRFKQGNSFDFELSTGLKVQRNHWSQSKQKVKIMTGSFDYADQVNLHLRRLKSYVLETYYSDLANGLSIGQAWLKTTVNSYFNKPSKNGEGYEIFLIPFINKFIDETKHRVNKKTGANLSNRTIQSYLTCTNKLAEFEKYENYKIKLTDINLDFHSKFENFLANKHLLNANTIGGYFDNIKLFCRNAEIRGLRVNPEFRSKEFHSPHNKTADIYLSIEEIELINNIDFSKSDRLDNARDWLIIGVWSGLRVSDLLRLNKDFIVDGMISITAKKTDINVIIPLHPTVIEILDKREGNFPKKISDQKFNLYIKEICKAAGINTITNGYKMIPIQKDKTTVYRKKFGAYEKHELVSSHICRRSFATNHYGKIDTLTIMKITGHKTEKQFLDYIKKTPTQYAKKLNDLWNKSE